MLISTTDYTSVRTKQRTLEDEASVAKSMYYTTEAKAYQEVLAERVGHIHHLHDTVSMSFLLLLYNYNQLCHLHDCTKYSINIETLALLTKWHFHYLQYSTY